MPYTILTDNKTPFERRLTIKVESGTIEEVWKEELVRLRGEVEIDGFRLGKAPLGVVERKVGRDAIWERVRDVMSHRIVDEIVRNSEKKPLTPPKYDFDEKESDDLDSEGDSGTNEAWKTGDSFEFTVTYNLPPPSPEEIERDLMRGVGKEAPAPEVSGIDSPHPPSVTPPDPRIEIPGSGILDVDPTKEP